MKKSSPFSIVYYHIFQDFLKITKILFNTSIHGLRQDSKFKFEGYKPRPYDLKGLFLSSYKLGQWVMSEFQLQGYWGRGVSSSLRPTENPCQIKKKEKISCIEVFHLRQLVVHGSNPSTWETDEFHCWNFESGLQVSSRTARDTNKTLSLRTDRQARWLRGQGCLEGRDACRHA